MGARTILWASLALAPVVFLLKWVFDVGDSVLFVVAALALVPLAWLIGEATEHAGEHTGPGIGGFLNATFGNAPELIIALIAVNSGLPNVVRGSLTGSVVSNILLVLGAASSSAATGPSTAARCSCSSGSSRSRRSPSSFRPSPAGTAIPSATRWRSSRSPSPWSCS